MKRTKSNFQFHENETREISFVVFRHMKIGCGYLLSAEKILKDTKTLYSYTILLPSLCEIFESCCIRSSFGLVSSQTCGETGSEYYVRQTLPILLVEFISHRCN